MVDMSVDVMDLVGHSVEHYCVADFCNDGTYSVTVLLDNEIVIGPFEFYFYDSASFTTTDETAQWLNSVGRKVLSARKSPCDHTFTLVFGNDDDETYFKVIVVSDRIRR